MGLPPSAKSFDSALSTSAFVMPSMASPLAPGSKLRMRLDHILFAAETMHVKRPLQPNDRPLDRAEQRERQSDRERHPDRQMLPHGEVACGFHAHEGAHHDVAHDHHDQIGRQIVGAMMMHFLAANLASIDGLEKGGEKPALAAVRAASKKAVPHRTHQRTRAPAGMWLSAKALFLHHRLLLRPRWPGCDARALALCPFALWNDRFEPGRGRGSLSISK